MQSMAEMDVARKKLLMEFFAEHFIAMAARSIEFNAYGQGNSNYSRVSSESTGTMKKNRPKLEAVILCGTVNGNSRFWFYSIRLITTILL